MMNWIDVNDRLPGYALTDSKGEGFGASLVLVCLDSGNVLVDWYDNNKESWTEHPDEVTHWMPLPEAPNKPTVNNYLLDLENLFEEYQSRYPFAYFELARTRITDWMCWIKENPKDSKPVVCEQGLSMEEVCVDAYQKLKAYLEV